MNRNQKGFTLTEILIVLVIAGILLALILPNSVRAIGRANAAGAQSDVRSCRAAVLTCYADNNNTWAAACQSVGGLQTAGYIDAAFTSAVSVVADGTGFTCR